MASRTIEGSSSGRVTRGTNKGRRLYDGSTLAESPPVAKKRKRAITQVSAPSGKRGNVSVVDLTEEDDGERMGQLKPAKKRKTNSPRKDQGEEKRLRKFREKAPLSYTGKLERAMGQR